MPSLGPPLRAEMERLMSIGRTRVLLDSQHVEPFLPQHDGLMLAILILASTQTQHSNKRASLFRARVAGKSADTHTAGSFSPTENGFVETLDMDRLNPAFAIAERDLKGACERSVIAEWELENPLSHHQTLVIAAFAGAVFDQGPNER